MVKIRLTRMGNAHNPHYRVVVVDQKQKRDGSYIENLGHYDPRKTSEHWLNINVERAKHWLSLGAQPTDTTKRLLKLAGVYKTV